MRRSWRRNCRKSHTHTHTWEGAIAPGGDTRDEPRQWQRCRRQSTRRPVERVGPRALLPAVQGCQQAPAAGAMDEDVIADDDDDVVDLLL